LIEENQQAAKSAATRKETEENNQCHVGKRKINKSITHCDCKHVYFPYGSVNRQSTRGSKRRRDRSQMCHNASDATFGPLMIEVYFMRYSHMCGWENPQED